MLSGTSIIILVAGLLDFDALRVGKISIIEPIYAMEVPVTIALTTLLIGEVLSATQLVLIVVLLVGIFLVSNKHLGKIHLKTIERGVFAAILATLGMGFSNFLFGFASRGSGPLMINWYTSAVMAVVTLVYLLYTHQGRILIANWKKNKGLILAVSVSDNLAWVAFSTSALYLPIGLATGMTESYIALAAILGIFYNNEKLRWHQRAGLLLSVCAAIVLALTSPV